MAKIEIGTLIHGTLRNEDLLPAFADELQRVSNAEHGLTADVHKFMFEIGDGFETDTERETGPELVTELIDALNEYAPPHVYFGAHPGDGADFGFWPDMDSLDGCEIVGNHENTESQFDLDCGIEIHTNDHGNVTVYALRGEELWSAV